MIVFVLCIISSIYPTYSISVTPNDVGIARGQNYTFTVTPTESYRFYTIYFENSQITPFIKTNDSTILVEFDVPNNLNYKGIHTFYIKLYDEYQYLTENATFRFFISNLTNDEMLALNSGYTTVSQDYYKQLNITTSVLEDLEDEKAKKTFWETWGKYVTTTFFVGLCSVSMLGVVGFKFKYSAHKKVKLSEYNEEKQKGNYNKVVATKKAFSFSALIYKQKKIEDDVIEVPLLNDFEKDAMQLYSQFCDVSFFLKPETNQLEVKKADGTKRPATSIDALRKRFESIKKVKDDYAYQVFILSGCLKFLDEKGLKDRNDELIPVGCTYENLSNYYKYLYDKMIEQTRNEEQKDKKEENPVEKKIKRIDRMIVKKEPSGVPTFTFEQEFENYSNL